MRVRIPSPLRSYTRKREVEGSGANLAELLTDLDRQYPGIRFRVVDEQNEIRKHIRFFVNGVQVFALDAPLCPTDEVQIVQALSGGV